MSKTKKIRIKSCVGAPETKTADQADIVIPDDDMQALLVQERECRRSEETMKEYQAAEVDTVHDSSWLAVTQELQMRIAKTYCHKRGLPLSCARKVVHQMHGSYHKEKFRDIGLPQQWPINRARRGNLRKGEQAPTVPLRPVMQGMPSHAVRFPEDVARKSYSVVVAGSYS